ncbi:hypothetical protein A4H97_33685 [Niastella yeongjuensis]|uniref:Protein kinase domain-containing protein n=1 Tax=Niastella yeongjuensis TaxID=354355 RepID=A0A1V9EDD0_9BACT|nr:protein kinase [Niastella yeongjuensis]OQP44126.1 hypothetical protein A4H97_33685 [Niastella yeongjuensis]SEP49224.1 Serine/threonine protein kinase [Niastella yeongjuensis]
MTAYKNALNIGETLQIDGKYKIIDVLGQGGFGITYLAKFTALEQTVAIKEYFPNMLCNRRGKEVVPIYQYSQFYTRFRTNFLEEAKQLALFKYDHIVRITDFFEENNTAYFVMDYIDGTTLQKLVTNSRFLDEEYAIDIIKQIGGALELVHDKGKLHRDIKPQNILIENTRKATLIDFGAAREIVETHVEHTAIFSEGFAPPEQYEGKGKKGPHIDVYGLGATLYFCVTGQIPISARARYEQELQSPSMINSSVSDELSKIIMKAMEMEISNRYANVSKLLYHLSTLTPKSQRKKNVEHTQSQKECLKYVTEFINDPETNLLILTGAACTGKSFIVGEILDLLQSSGYSLRPLTLGSRLAERLNWNTGLYFSSIYSYIYDLDESVPEVRGKGEIEIPEDEWFEGDAESPVFPLKANTDEEKVIYIVDESQLISDHYWEDGLVSFGSGKLLTDFISFTEIQTIKQRKVIFVGDEKEILRGPKDASAISISYLQSAFGLNVRALELKDIYNRDRQPKFIQQALNIYQNLDDGLFNELIIKADEKSLFCLNDNQFKEKYLASESESNKVFITYSNKQAHEANNRIRALLGKNGNIKPGDRIILNNSIKYGLDGMLHEVFSGELGVITEVNEEIELFNQPVKGKGVISAVFRRVSVFFPRLGATTSIIILEDYLNSESKEISKEQRLLINIRAKKSFKQHFPKEKLHFNNWRHQLKADEYFNTALVKYAYSLTGHKAQLLKFNSVFIDCETDKGKDNDEYFRWMYTALKCGSNSVYLINAPSINPLSYLNIDNNPSAFDITLQKRGDIDLLDIKITEEIKAQAVLFNLSSNDKLVFNLFAFCIIRLLGTEIRVRKIDHNNYQEIYHFQDNNGVQARISFHYNSAAKISRVAPIQKNNLSDRILFLLYNNSQKDFSSVFNQAFVKAIYMRLREDLSLKYIAAFDVTPQNYSYQFSFSRDKEVVIANLFFNNSGFITKFYPIKYNSKDLLSVIIDVFQKIKESYEGY